MKTNLESSVVLDVRIISLFLKTNELMRNSLFHNICTILHNTFIYKCVQVIKIKNVFSSSFLKTLKFMERHPKLLKRSKNCFSCDLYALSVLVKQFPKNRLYIRLHNTTSLVVHMGSFKQTNFSCSYGKF